MTDKERERSYEHYKQWQINKVRYEHECIGYTLIFGIGLFFVIKYWQDIIMMVGIALIIGAIALLLNIFKKWYSMRRGIKELENMVKDAGATNVEVDYEGGMIKFDFAPQFTEEKLLEFKNAVSRMGLKMNVTRVNNKTDNEEDVMNTNEEKFNSLKSTEIGYINKNNQRNNGKTDIPGTGNGQWFYDMECLGCGHKYHANGHDVWLRKCPKCQGGRP